MPVDRETELVQLWAGSRGVAKLLKEMLDAEQGSKTIAAAGLRSGRDHQLAGLMQILDLTQSYTLEIAIKALFKSLNPETNPEETHDLQRLFDSLPKDTKRQIESNWLKVGGRSPLAQELKFRDFLEGYALLFEESRYLFEKDRNFTRNTKDFDIAVWVVTATMMKRPDTTFLFNVFNVLAEEIGGLGEFVQND